MGLREGSSHAGLRMEDPMLPVPRFTPTVRKSRPQPIGLMEGLKKVQVRPWLLCNPPVQQGALVHSLAAPVHMRAACDSGRKSQHPPCIDQTCYELICAAPSLQEQ